MDGNRRVSLGWEWAGFPCAGTNGFLCREEGGGRGVLGACAGLGLLQAWLQVLKMLD